MDVLTHPYILSRRQSRGKPRGIGPKRLKHPFISLEVLAMIFMNGPDRASTDAEHQDHLTLLDCDYERGQLDAEYLAGAKRILAQSPWRDYEDTISFCQRVRTKYGYGRERFWWYPEEWGKL